MTLKQFEAKIRELIRTEKAAILAGAIRLYKSGAVDTSLYNDNYILPRLILVTVLKNRGTCNPLRSNPEFHRTLKNLEKF